MQAVSTRLPALGKAGHDPEILVSSHQTLVDVRQMRVSGRLVERVRVKRFEIALVGIAQGFGFRGRCRGDDKDEGSARMSKDRSRL